MGLTPIALEVINSGYISDTSRTSARFQIDALDDDSYSGSEHV